MAKNTKSGEWFQPVNDASPSKVETPQVSNISCLSNDESSSAPETPRSRIRSDDTDFVKLAKEGGHKDLLSPRPADPSPSPKKAEVNRADWYYQDQLNNNDQPKPQLKIIKETDTEFLKTAKQGGHKDLLAIKEHKPTVEAVKYEKKGGDWYTHDALNGVDGPPATPRSKVKENDTQFLKLCKEGGHKDLLEIKEHKPTKEPAKYSKKGGDWYYQDGVDVKESLQRRDSATPDSARVRRNYSKLQVKNTDSEYVKTAKRGGHSDLLKTPRNTPSKAPVNYKRSDWFYLEDNKKQPKERPKSAPRRSRTMESSILPGADSVDAGSRPRTAAYRKSDPIWLGGSGPQVQPSPRKHINRDSGLAPYALHN